jgi:hypothetical protein
MSETIPPKTVLILGAGGSHDCNFPLGTDLIDRITTLHRQENFVLSIRRILFHCRDYINHNGLLDYLPKEMAAAISHEKKRTLINLPNEHYSNWTNEIGPFRSIDEFISYRKEHSLLAKLSILLAISESESPGFFENKTFKDKHPNFNHGPERTWYNQLWGNIVRKKISFEELKRILNTLHIITFNYDRSIDYFLLDAIKKFFPESEKDYTDLPITHVYGSIGDLNSSSQNYNPYKQIYYKTGTDIPPEYKITDVTVYDTFSGPDAQRSKYDEHLLKLAIQIETYGNEYRKEKAEKIQELIRNAKSTYAFGFSFQDQNMKILFKEPEDGQAPVPSHGTFDGTCFKMPSERLMELRLLTSRYFGEEPRFLNDDRKKINIADFFADYSIKL